MTKRIIVLLISNINYDCRVQREIDEFCLLGFRVTLVVWSREPIFYKKEKLDIINIELGNFKHPYGKLFSFLTRIRFCYSASKIIKKGNYDYIHCNDLDTLGILYFLPKSYYERVIYDAHELYPEAYKINSIQYKIWNLIEKQLIKRVGTIITPEINRSKFLKEKYKLNDIPYVISNFPQYRRIMPRNIKAELNILKGKIILTYIGALEPGREIEVIIEALNYLPDDFVVVLIGYAYDDNYIKTLRGFIEGQGLTNRVFFYGSVSPKEMLPTIAGCDIGIALYENTGFNSFYCAPNKVFDYIMAGVKVIANDYPSLKMLNKYEFVRLISKVNPKAIAKCALDLVRDSSEIPDIIKRKFSWESVSKIFKEIYI